MENRKPRCHNCEHAGPQFKIDKLTHLHCANPEYYNKEAFDSEDFRAWDTLRVFNDTCDNHKFKSKK